MFFLGQPFRICCFSPWKMRLGRRQCYRRRPSTLTCRCGIPILLSYGLGVIEWQIHLKYPWRSSMISDISMFNPLSKGIGIVMFKHVSRQLLIPTHWIPSSPFCPSNKNSESKSEQPHCPLSNYVLDLHISRRPTEMIPMIHVSPIEATLQNLPKKTKTRNNSSHPMPP